jgi:hypothetical protein
MGIEAGRLGAGSRGPELRRAAVRRVLAAAAELRREPEPAPAPRLLAETARGCLELGSRRRILIGRGRGCDLVLEEGGVSRLHAALVLRGGEWWIEDLGSANGVWRRGERVQRCRVADGEEFRLCRAAVRFHLW